MPARLCVVYLPEFLAPHSHGDELRRYLTHLSEQGFGKILLLHKKGSQHQGMSCKSHLAWLPWPSPAALEQHLAPSPSFLFLTAPFFLSCQWQDLLAAGPGKIGLTLVEPPPDHHPLLLSPDGVLSEQVVTDHQTPYRDAYHWTGALTLNYQQWQELFPSKAGPRPREPGPWLLPSLLQKPWHGVLLAGQLLQPGPTGENKQLWASWQRYSSQKPRPCLFLDRDGVIIADSGYPYRPEELKLLAGIKPLIAWAKEQGWLTIVVSNQAGLAKAKFGPQQLDQATTYLNTTLARQGLQPDDWYYCPYHPDASVPAYRYHSLSRKPGPGMLLQAMARYRINLAASWMVGDKDSDVISLPGLRSLLIQGRYPLSRNDVPIFANHAAVLHHLKRQQRENLPTTPCEDHA